jgi:hypothetical protein
MRCRIFSNACGLKIIRIPSKETGADDQNHEKRHGQHAEKAEEELVEVFIEKFHSDGESYKPV